MHQGAVPAAQVQNGSVLCDREMPAHQLLQVRYPGAQTVGSFRRDGFVARIYIVRINALAVAFMIYERDDWIFLSGQELDYESLGFAMIGSTR